jgi:hypothetical protein
VGFGKMTGIARRNALVDLAVHHYQRARCGASRRDDRPDVPEHAGPRRMNSCMPSLTLGKSVSDRLM